MTETAIMRSLYAESVSGSQTAACELFELQQQGGISRFYPQGRISTDYDGLNVVILRPLGADCLGGATLSVARPTRRLQLMRRQVISLVRQLGECDRSGDFGQSGFSQLPKAGGRYFELYSMQAARHYDLTAKQASALSFELTLGLVNTAVLNEGLKQLLREIGL